MPSHHCSIGALRSAARWTVKYWACPCFVLSCTIALSCDPPRFEPHPVTATLEGTGGQTASSTSAVPTRSGGVDFWVYSRCKEAFFAIGPAHANPEKRIAVAEIDFFHLDKGSGIRTAAPAGSRVWLLAAKDKVIARARVTKDLATISAVGKPECESLVIKLGAAR